MYGHTRYVAEVLHINVLVVSVRVPNTALGINRSDGANVLLMSNRTNRHLVIEGPDGAGKSELVKYLSAALDLPVARRIADSKTGVRGKDLATYVDEDMSRWANYISRDPVINRSAFSDMSVPTPSRIYDRYPLISEPIYGLHVRKGPQSRFLTPWYAGAWQKFLAFEPLVVFCLPPYETVAGNVSPNRDMDGVWRNISMLYQAYHVEALKYQGHCMIYNYTIHKPERIADAALGHVYR